MFQRWTQSAPKPFRVQRARNIQLQEADIQGPLNSDPENAAGALSSAGSHQSGCHNKTLDLVASPPTLSSVLRVAALQLQEYKATESIPTLESYRVRFPV